MFDSVLLSFPPVGGIVRAIGGGSAFCFYEDTNAASSESSWANDSHGQGVTMEILVQAWNLVVAKGKEGFLQARNRSRRNPGGNSTLTILVLM